MVDEGQQRTPKGNLKGNRKLLVQFGFDHVSLAVRSILILNLRIDKVSNLAFIDLLVRVNVEPVLGRHRLGHVDCQDVGNHRHRDGG